MLKPMKVAELDSYEYEEQSFGCYKERSQPSKRIVKQFLKKSPIV